MGTPSIYELARHKDDPAFKAKLSASRNKWKANHPEAAKMVSDHSNAVHRARIMIKRLGGEHTLYTAEGVIKVKLVA